MTWHTFFEIDPGFTEGRSAVTCITRDPDHLDLFVTGNDGSVHTVYWNSVGGWSSWSRIDPGFALARSEVTAIATGAGHLDLFVTGIDGGVHSAYWDDASGWSSWFRIDPGFANARSSVTVVARDPEHLDLFVTGNDGGVHSAYWSMASPWSSWFRIDAGFASAWSAVAAIARDADHLDLFVTGNDGGVHSAYWNTASTWSSWFRIDAGFAAARSAVTAIARHPDHLDLFVTGSGGAVHSAYWDSASTWSDWFRIDAGFAMGRSAVTAVARTPDHLDLFVAGQDGAIHSAYWDAASTWSNWFRIDKGFSRALSEVAAVARRPDQLDLFVLGTDDRVYSAWWDPAPGVLRGVSITFDTHDDKRERQNLVNVYVRNREANSLTPHATTDHLANYLELQRYGPGGDLNQGERNPFLAYGYALGFSDEFDDPSSHTFDLVLAADDIGVNDVVMPQIDIHMLANGDDQWIFDYTVTLTFDDGPVTFSSTVDGVTGIVLDQDNRNHSGIGIENPLRSIAPAALPPPDTAAVLTKVRLRLSTHNDDKNEDTRLNVHVTNRLSAGAFQDMAIGLDLFHDQRFPESGPRDDLYREFIWSAEDNTLISRSIRLAEMVLPMVYIVIEPSESDRWIFDYQVTFEFTDPGSFGGKPLVFTSQTSGVVLDQDNRKHAGAYQGDPFPTAAPPTAPRLTRQPVDMTGDRAKVISIPFLRRKLDEFINGRNGADTSAASPLQRIRLGSTLGYPYLPFIDPNNPIPLPASYLDIQSLANGGDGQVHRVRHPQDLGPLKKWIGIADSYLGEIESATFQIGIETLASPPLTLGIAFRPGGFVWNNADGVIDIRQMAITLKLTLEKTTIVNRFTQSHTVVDLFAWAKELEEMTVTEVQIGVLAAKHYKGTFLHQPIDTVTTDDLLAGLLDQVIRVDLETSSAFDGLIRSTIRDRIHGKLLDVDPMSGRSARDGLNSMVTSWLLGGVADDELNTDDNNIVIHGVGLIAANPELAIPEDVIALDYEGPRNVFVPEAPSGWPASAAADFSPSVLDNIDHIVVLTKENRSFDHLLGYLSLPVDQGGMGRSEVDGLTGSKSNEWRGQVYPPVKLERTRFVPGTPNGYESVHHTINGGRMGGFVAAYGPGVRNELAGQAMGYYSGTAVPVYDALARDFSIGHRWFCSHPGPTFPNRFYELTGRPNLDARGFWELENSSPMLPVFTPTIFDHLNGARDPVSGAPVTWRYFENSYCTLRFFQRYTFDHEHVVAIDDPAEGFFACAQSGRLPSVAFIDPHFVDYPPGSNCDEPPSDIADGQAFAQRIVDAVVASPAWPRTLLLIVYDEHGGFYDHVPPPSAARVSPDFPVTTLGLRVPALIVSPWVAAGSVFGDDNGLHFDHTSILKTIVRRFLRSNPPYMGARYAEAKDLSTVLAGVRREPQFLPFIRYGLQYARSGMMLDAGSLDPAPGSTPQQARADGSIVQDFSFEDAGDGSVRVRSRAGRLYLAAPDPASIVVVASPTTAGATWKIAPIGDSVLDRRLFTISNPSHPGLLLQPARPDDAQSPLVLGAGGTTGTVGLGRAQAWRIASPLLGDDQVTTR